ncbi:hypothetical protein Droror1_Dr00005546 [Drosera rotundifolia]
MGLSGLWVSHPLLSSPGCVGIGVHMWVNLSTREAERKFNYWITLLCGVHTTCFMECHSDIKRLWTYLSAKHCVLVISKSLDWSRGRRLFLSRFVATGVMHA